MKYLYQTFMPFFKTSHLIKPEYVILKYLEFLLKVTLNETPARSENHICFMDYYKLQQMNILKQIGIKAYSYQNEIL
jgi:hypothetical protein